MRGAGAAAVAAFIATMLCGCGGGSHSSSSAVDTQPHRHSGTTTQAQPQTTTTTTGKGQNGGHGSHAHQPPAHKKHRKSVTPRRRPLARLATACRAAPRLGGGATGKGKQSTHAEAARLTIRIRLIMGALGPPSSDAGAAPILAPFRHALTRARKAVRRASVSSRPRAAQRLQRAIARESAAAQQIGLPECALGSG